MYQAKLPEHTEVLMLLYLLSAHLHITKCSIVLILSYGLYALTQLELAELHFK